MTAEPTEVSTERPELKRAIGGFGFFALAFGSMIASSMVSRSSGAYTAPDTPFRVTAA